MGIRPRPIVRCVVAALLLATLISCGRSTPAARQTTAPALDVLAYPQDTPEHTLGSIITTMDQRAYAYLISHLIDPNDAMAMIEKRGGLDRAVEFLNDEKRADKMKASREMMQKLLKGSAPVEGEERGVKFVRYQEGDKTLQLNKQADGRWCMSTQFFKSKSASTPADGPQQTSGTK